MSIESTILQMVLDLKRSANPVTAYKQAELYLIDDDYDVTITVGLKPKKTQYELGMNMFHGESRK